MNSQWLEPGDLRVPLRSAGEEETLWLLASQRLFPADKKYQGEKQAAMQSERCPCGCGVYGWANAFLSSVQGTAAGTGSCGGGSASGSGGNELQDSWAGAEAMERVHGSLSDRSSQPRLS